MQEMWNNVEPPSAKSRSLKPLEWHISEMDTEAYVTCSIQSYTVQFF